MNFSDISKKISFIPEITKKFPKAEVYLVGGMVRDILLGRASDDFDFVVRGVKIDDLEKFLKPFGATDLVGKSFGVFKLRIQNPQTEGFFDIDISLPRTEHSFGTGGYRDFDVKANPDLPIEEDLKRRDFTVNAMAYLVESQKSIKSKVDTIIDPFGGQEDLKNKIIRTVGEADERFREDYTRMIRAVRFAVQLGFDIEDKTLLAIKKNAKGILKMAPERIQEEFTKIIMTSEAERGIRLLEETGLLELLIPELRDGIGVAQNRSHIYTIFEHNVRSLKFAAQSGFPLTVRLAALFHDIAKAKTKAGHGQTSTFYNHDIEGAKMTKKIMAKFKYSQDIMDHTVHLVRYHMFYYDFNIVSDAGVRRFIRRVGPENVADLINLRMADRIGMGRPKAKPYKLVELERRMKIVQLDPISAKMLNVNGDDLIKIFKLQPGPRFKFLLEALLAEVLEDPKKNDREYLLSKLTELNKLGDEELKKLSPDIESYEEERKRGIK